MSKANQIPGQHMGSSPGLETWPQVGLGVNDVCGHCRGLWLSQTDWVTDLPKDRGESEVRLIPEPITAWSPLRRAQHS